MGKGKRRSFVPGGRRKRTLPTRTLSLLAAHKLRDSSPFEQLMMSCPPDTRADLERVISLMIEQITLYRDGYSRWRCTNCQEILCGADSNTGEWIRGTCLAATVTFARRWGHRLLGC